MSSASSPSASPRVSALADPTRLAQSYKTLLDEYAKTRAQNAILKRALVEEQALAKQLQADGKVKDVELRKARDDLDMYRLQSEKLSRTVKVLQDDLSSKRQSKGAPQRDTWTEQQESIEQILEEFQKKSEQAENLTRDLAHERRRTEQLQELLRESKASKDQLAKDFEAQAAEAAALKLQLYDAARDGELRAKEYEDKLSARMSTVRLVESRQLVIQAEVRCAERQPEGVAAAPLKGVFGLWVPLVEASCRFAEAFGGAGEEPRAQTDFEPVREANRSLAEAVDIFDDVFAGSDLGPEERSPAVKQLLRRVRGLGAALATTLDIAGRPLLGAIGTALERYEGRLERIAEDFSDSEKVPWAVRTESLRLLVDWFAAWEGIAEKVPQAHRDVDSILELIVQSIRSSDPDLADLLPLRKLLDTIRSCVRDLEAAGLESGRVASELAATREALDSMSAELDTCRSVTLASLEKKLGTSEAEVARLSAELKSANEKLAAEVERLEGDLAMIGEETARLVREVETLTTDKQAVEGQLEARTSELRDRTTELDLLRSQVAERESWAKSLEHDVRVLRKHLKDAAAVVRVSPAEATPGDVDGEPSPGSEPSPATGPADLDVKATLVPTPSPGTGGDGFVALAHMTRDQLEARVGYLSDKLQETDAKLYKCFAALERLQRAHQP
ncbi:hypothetical protein DFJ74DRAFT_703579 [Hyaloraphidium curvatum]|nr:hypothetical protein DFJ74DRAFT_703579 [Hyaloraphidium curvatum]